MANTRKARPTTRRATPQKKVDPSLYDELYVDVELSNGDVIENVDALRFIDPDEAMVAAQEDGNVLSTYDVIRLMGVDPSGWRASKVSDFFERLKDAIAEATELEPGESDGSETSSEPTEKKSNTRSSARG